MEIVWVSMHPYLVMLIAIKFELSLLNWTMVVNGWSKQRYDYLGSCVTIS